MKNTDIAHSLKLHFSGKQEFTTKEIKNAIEEQFPDLSANTISWRLNQLKKEKLLFQVGRGLYTFIYKPDFSAELSLKSKRLYNRIKGIYSGEVVMWDTLLLNEIGNQDISKYWIFLAINKDDLDPIFNDMLSFSKKVFLHPDKETTTRYLIPQDEAIILTALISETPIERRGDYLSPTLEGILVNAWFEYEQYLKPIGFDIQKLFAQAFTKYNVNTNQLLRYAARRDKRKEIEELIKKIK